MTAMVIKDVACSQASDLLLIEQLFTSYSPAVILCMGTSPLSGYSNKFVGCR